jgi:hypothetical protein
MYKVKQYSFLNEALTPSDIKLGLKMLKRDYVVKPLAKFSYGLRKGDRLPHYIYNTTMGVKTGADMAASSAIMGLAQKHIHSAIPQLPLPGRTTFKSIGSILNDSNAVKSQKFKKLVKHPIKTTAKAAYDTAVSPFVDMVTMPYDYIKNGLKVTKKIPNTFDNKTVDFTNPDVIRKYMYGKTVKTPTGSMKTSITAQPLYSPSGEIYGYKI